jgi:C4-dicarboxylate-specific signal transduction histidine kinase
MKPVDDDIAAALRRTQEELRVRSEALEEQRQLADLGELAIPLAHEFSNVLNAVLLHLAVLEQQIPDQSRAGFAEIRKQSKAITALMREFQQARRTASPSRAIDLPNAVKQAAMLAQHHQNLEQTPDSKLANAVQFGATPTSAEVAANECDLIRFFYFLLKNALAAGGQVTVQFETSGDTIRVVIEDAGADVGAESAARLFDAPSDRRPGTSALELAACKTLARKLRATIGAEHRSGGGIVVDVVLAKRQTT